MYKPHVEREMLGVALHTALRKLCYSTPTSIQWKGFSLMPTEIFGMYLDAVWEKLKDTKHESEAYRAIVLASLEFMDYFSDKRRESFIKDGLQWANLVTCTFEMFEDSDWKSYTYWVVEGDK